MYTFIYGIERFFGKLAKTPVQIVHHIEEWEDFVSTS